MALTEETRVGPITAHVNGVLEIRDETQILKDGEPYGPARYHRRILAPGDALNGQDPRIVAIATETWTPVVVSAYQAAVEARRAQLPGT
jgi:hypothetical protein